LSKPTSLRLAAARALLGVCEEGLSLDDAIALQGQKLIESDLSLFKALCYGGTRWMLWYQQQVRSKLKKPLKPKDRILEDLLIVALFELEQMNTATHAVVNETVKATKALNRDWAKGFINAILRNFLRELDQQKTGESTTNIKPAEQCYPKWLVKQIQHDWPAHSEAILSASLEQPPLTLRVNQSKTTADEMLVSLQEADIDATKCIDSKVGFTLGTPVAVSKILGFEKGLVSVQDESAQLCVELLTLEKGQHVLDACAAPGGKTGHILEAQTELGSVTAVDFEHRLSRFHENMERLGFSPKVISLDKQQATDSSWWDGQLFDHILLDVPCTGTGVIRRHPDIKFRRSEQNSLQFAEQQSALLNQNWAMLKTGGQLLYTTCSIFALENDQRIAAFLGEHNDAQCCSLPDYLGLETTNGRQRLPGVHQGDGFYYALLKKV
jgi:16S rRNA (cytosine967-C5)-methyltransferase